MPRRLRWTAAALLFVMAPTLGGNLAWAQGDEATTKAARARFLEGVEFYDKKQYEAARAAFLQAYALRKHPSVLLNLAQSSLRAVSSPSCARTRSSNDEWVSPPRQERDEAEG